MCVWILKSPLVLRLQPVRATPENGNKSYPPSSPASQQGPSWSERKRVQFILVWSSVLGLGRVSSLLHVQGLEEGFARQPWIVPSSKGRSLSLHCMASFSFIFCAILWIPGLLAQSLKTKNVVHKKWTLKMVYPSGLPWWVSGKESACQCRGHGFDLSSGKIPYAVGHLSPAPQLPKPTHLGLCSATRGATSVRSLCIPTRE